MERTKKRIAAMADIHVKSTDRGIWRDTFELLNAEADILVICGDLTDTGDEDEASVLGEALNSLHIPVIGVLGNHDFEKGRQKIIKQILTEHKMILLDGEYAVAGDIGFAGTKGFGGGFDQFMLSVFGEDMMKQFVHEAVNESLQLDRALTRLEQEHPTLPKVALLHYAPIRNTVKGEPEQLYPFLGSSHLGEALNRRNVAVAFHGHAHGGTVFGQTSSNIPVYNVALPLLKNQQLGKHYMVIEV
ncbi:metallophosphoesterase [Sphingobacterium sp. DK4209]|uniref:Metallophosphoesterase n=1 Tax=Sphingobacterium zhuxiongii TaxID=2662364 RepID=A0A5Q0Q6J3_9SPHI|nr:MULTISPECIES: metallophosphoesterase [unclassified Sphingobacterium]MVZ67437.1 metallophosphoesterase [Sphingobacterium sp. DK4209]QGA24864.1 metallophosphoesterase [Sphingobacterium sp. dk4302]